MKIDKDLEYWRYRAISVTKYDPKLRNSEGHYMEDDWTSISDVGKTYNGVMFTKEQHEFML